jgi:hypothetical protein
MANSLIMSNSNLSLPLTIGSYNSRGFNRTKQTYVAGLMSKTDVVFLQEHWLSESQLGVIGGIMPNILYTGVSGFDNSEVLLGRPYGGCAILWKSDLLAKISIVDVN